MSNAQAPASEKGQGHQEVFIPESYHFHLRGRAIKSCLECRRRKMRCSRSQPCQNCNRFRRKCIYLPLPDWPAAHSPESVTQESRPSGRWDTTFEDTVFPTYAHSDPDWHGSRVRRGFALDTDYGAKQDGIYSVDADNESPDRILQIGRLRITERIGGMFRPDIGKRVSLARSSSLAAGIPAPMTTFTTGAT